MTVGSRAWSAPLQPRGWAPALHTAEPAPPSAHGEGNIRVRRTCVSVSLSRCTVKVCFRNVSLAELPHWCTSVQRHEPPPPVGDSGRAVGVQSGHLQPHNLCLYPKVLIKSCPF